MEPLSISPESLQNVTAVVLAGGKGTRLRAVVSQRPKVLADVGGRPFLAYVLDRLDTQGIRSAVLCVGYMGEQVRETFGERHGNIRIAYSVEETLLGTAGAVRLALPLIESSEILMLNGDSVVKADFRHFAERHRAKKGQASMLLAEVADARRYGQVAVDEDEKVLQFVEKGSGEGPGWINAGVYMLQREIVERIPSERPVSIEKEVFPNLVGRSFFGFKSAGEFLDIGIPEDYARGAAFFDVSRS